MIDNAFWKKLAGEWRKKEDPVEIPPVEPVEPIETDPDDPVDIDDILADFDI